MTLEEEINRYLKGTDLDGCELSAAAKEAIIQKVAEFVRARDEEIIHQVRRVSHKVPQMTKIQLITYFNSFDL